MDCLTLFSGLGHKKSLLHSCMDEETPRKFTAKTLPRGSGLLFPPLAFSCLCFYPVKFTVLLPNVFDEIHASVDKHENFQM
ncbi:hypothetical protein Peur_069960 [Populus x canadensis]